MFQSILRAASIGVIHALRPVKIFAYRTRSEALKRLIIESTAAVDFGLVFANVQNGAMLLHHEAYGGNFIFGKAVMVTDHATQERELPLPSYRTKRFMGVDLVGAAGDVFATNTGMITQCQPTRGLVRAHIDAEVIPPSIRDVTYEEIREKCADILAEWARDPKMADGAVIRGNVTRIILKVLTGTTVSYADAQSVTSAYARRFGELSLFDRYAPFLTGVLGSREAIRRDAYFVLRRYGFDNLVIDMTLFAAMFSIGTLVMRCIDDIGAYKSDYQALDGKGRTRFIIESVRLFPTVTTTHRVVESPETVVVDGVELRLQPGDEVCYPLITSNRDPAVFNRPGDHVVDRPDAEVAKVLSWSLGAHGCPAKDLSIQVTRVMLDALAERFQLSTLSYGRSLF